MARPKKEDKVDLQETPIITDSETNPTETELSNNSNETSSPTDKDVKNESTEAQIGEVKKNESTEAKIEKHIDDILKVYTQYKSLYIDHNGGVFTSDTNKNIRGNSILYQNPYFNE